MKRASLCDLLLGGGLQFVVRIIKELSRVLCLLMVVYLAVQIVETVWTGRLTVKTSKPMTSLFLYVLLFNDSF